MKTLVTRETFEAVVMRLEEALKLAVDTETTGLRVHHGDRLFSIIISDASDDFYFNFQAYANQSANEVLGTPHLKRLKAFFGRPITWVFHHAKFDLSMLEAEGIEVEGAVYCTKMMARVERNDWSAAYSLAECLERIGEKKDDGVLKAIDELGLWEWAQVPGKKQRVKNKFFDRVPFDIIMPYGCQDGRGTYNLHQAQVSSLVAQDLDTPELVESGRSLKNVMENEMRLIKTVYNMEARGVLIDKCYCNRARDFETARGERAGEAFKRETGHAYQASPKLFESVFADEKELWGVTEKGNPSFESEALGRLKNPAAALVLELRDAKSKSDFYSSFLYYADSRGVVHPNFNSGGTVHGRFSSSEPNFQNLTSEEDEGQIEQEFIVRRAIIPRPGFVFIMPDYDQMEYRFMLETACKLLDRETDLVRLIKSGLDVHDATVRLVKEKTGVEIKRKVAKISNFLTLYGGGPARLAEAIGSDVETARGIREVIFSAAPEINQYIRAISRIAEQRGYIVNWLGRRCYFNDPNKSYRAPNYHISGGCADIVKVAMNRIDELQKNFKSRMVMTIHDELPIEVHESELGVFPQLVKEIMEQVYASLYMPLTTGMEWSAKSLGDKQKGFPI